MNVLALFGKVKAFVFDIDGVLTNGQVLILPDIHPEGRLMMARAMSTKDGYAIQLAVKLGYPVAVISGGKNSGAELRLQALGVQHIFMGVAHKIEVFDNFLQSQGLEREDALYMGDDIPDYDILKIAGVRTCPADAVTEIKEISDYISPFKGGESCARDVIEKVLKLQGKWNVDTTAKSI
ncbi:3-deoxy-D-manno-octulosonate 8-phosphate phosphatase [Arachidicoccus ginsenosidimutans]|uniref:KdsC family phosphatase n=1 Tax=Arachidicoccus sp. BS20 TaxID=1850526 RepID=UPI0007F0BFC6|nr:3-deoxy-D-manno-octulosonate 8-phosphate phosphatase [Arachidicoccus sp. BS20]ANI88353.1 3-deoxy-D-manno-octulosonate 8-phosphate phosphatase [Arachidicoccus sp. BS20]